MSTATKKFKLGRDSLSYLLLKLPNMRPLKRYSMDHKTPQHPQLGIERLQRVFLKGKVFEWAVLYDNQSNQVQAYYHPKTQDQPLDKSSFYKALQKPKIKLYIIYTPAYKLKTGRTKGLSMPIESLEEVPQYWTPEVAKIMIYQDGKHTHNFIKGQFFTL